MNADIDVEDLQAADEALEFFMQSWLDAENNPTALILAMARVVNETVDAAKGMSDVTPEGQIYQ